MRLHGGPSALRRVVARCLLALGVLGGFASCGRGQNDGNHVEVTVAAAASLRSVLPELIAAFNAEHGRPTIATAYGASGDLRKRVQDGAPIDAVLFAASDPVDQLIKTGHVLADSRRVIAHNRLVLIGPKGGRRIEWNSLDAIPEGEKLAIGEPEAVPAGAYAKKALQALGKWDALSGRMVFGGDVAAVLAYARRGEVIGAIVYATEVVGIDDVVVFDEATGAWAPKADVVVGAVKDASHARQASSFLDFLSSPKARGILKARGFELDG